MKSSNTSSGFDTSDPRILRLVSLAAQKFVSEVASDALTHNKLRAVNQPSKTKVSLQLHTMHQYAVKT